MRSRYFYRVCSPWIIALTSSDAQKSPVTLNSCFIIAVIADCFLSKIAIFIFRNCFISQKFQLSKKKLLHIASFERMCYNLP